MLPENTHLCQMWWRCKTCREMRERDGNVVSELFVKQQIPSQQVLPWSGNITAYSCSPGKQRISVPNYNCGNRGKILKFGKLILFGFFLWKANGLTWPKDATKLKKKKFFLPETEEETKGSLKAVQLFLFPSRYTCMPPYHHKSTETATETISAAANQFWLLWDWKVFVANGETERQTHLWQDQPLTICQELPKKHSEALSHFKALSKF